MVMPWRRVAILVILGLAIAYALWAFFLPPHARASTSDDAEDPLLRPRCYAASVHAVIDEAHFIVLRADDWSLKSVDAHAGTLRAVHETRFFGFRDDVILVASPVLGGPNDTTSENATRVEASSASRFGKRDLGQNAANLRELLGALDARLSRCPEE